MIPSLLRTLIWVMLFCSYIASVVAYRPVKSQNIEVFVSPFIVLHKEGLTLTENVLQFAASATGLLDGQLHARQQVAYSTALSPLLFATTRAVLRSVCTPS